MINSICRLTGFSQSLAKTVRLAAWFLAAASCTSTSSLASSLTIQSNFESGLEGWQTELCCNSSARVVNDPEPSEAGDRALRIELSKDDPTVNSSKRAEIKLRPVAANSEYTYRFSIFLPDSFIADPNRELVAQWHGLPDFSLGEDWRTPPLALNTVNGQWQIVRRWDANAVTPKRNIPGQQSIYLGEYSTGTWTDWLFQVKWSHTADGILKIWKDSELVVEENGPNTYNDRTGPYFKAGIYKPGWKHRPERSVVDERVVFFDDINVVDFIEVASLDVDSGSAAVPEPLTVLGTVTALGLGVLFKRRYVK